MSLGQEGGLAPAYLHQHQRKFESSANNVMNSRPQNLEIRAHDAGG
jgi:hypothetical protein